MLQACLAIRLIQLHHRAILDRSISIIRVWRLQAASQVPRDQAGGAPRARRTSSSWNPNNTQREEAPMERYIGMDVHAASCTLAVISEKGRKLKDFPVETNGQALVEAVRMIPGTSTWCSRRDFRAPGCTRRCVRTWTSSWSPGSRRAGDRRATNAMRMGWPRSCAWGISTSLCSRHRVEFTRLRELSRIHMTLVGDVVRVQARIKSLYRGRGVRVTGVDVYGTRRRKEWQSQLPSVAQTRAIRLYDHFDFLQEQKEQAESDLLREAQKHRHRPDSGNGAGLWTDPLRTVGPDCRHASPLPYPSDSSGATAAWAS